MVDLLFQVFAVCPSLIVEKRIDDGIHHAQRQQWQSAISRLHRRLVRAELQHDPHDTGDDNSQRIYSTNSKQAFDAEHGPK